MPPSPVQPRANTGFQLIIRYRSFCTQSAQIKPNGIILSQHRPSRESKDARLLAGDFLGYRRLCQCHEQFGNRWAAGRHHMVRHDHLQLSGFAERLSGELLRQWRTDDVGLYARRPPQMQQAINYAIGLITSYTNANIQYAGTNGADIAIAQSPAANPTSYAYYPAKRCGGRRRLVRHRLQLFAGVARQLLFHDGAARTRPRLRPEAQPGDRRRRQCRGAGGA